MAEELDKTLPNPKPFRWTPAKETASLLVAEDELTNEQIAEKVGVTRQALQQWKVCPSFRARVDELAAEIRQRIRSRGIAITENRVKALQDRWDRMTRVIAERAADPEMQTVPGGTTGLLVHDVKSVGAGTAAKCVDVYEVDTGLLKELREHEKQAAQELGQWTEKQDVTLPGSIVVKVLNGVSMSELH